MGLPSVLDRPSPASKISSVWAAAAARGKVGVAAVPHLRCVRRKQAPRKGSACPIGRLNRGPVRGTRGESEVSQLGREPVAAPVRNEGLGQEFGQGSREGRCRVPKASKLKGIAGGMGAGLPKYVTVNLGDIASLEFQDGVEVTLEVVKERRLINPSGREGKLPLKVLGDGEVDAKLNIKAGKFSASARTKLEALGCTLEVLPGRKKLLGYMCSEGFGSYRGVFCKEEGRRWQLLAGWSCMRRRPILCEFRAGMLREMNPQVCCFTRLGESGLKCTE